LIQGMIIALLITMPVIYVLRMVLGKRAQALMLKSSPKEGNTRVLSGEIADQVAKTTPKLLELDRESIDPNSDTVRHAQTRGSLHLFRRWIIYDAVGVAGVLSLWQLFFWSVGGEAKNLLPVNYVSGGFIVLLCIRYFVYAGNYKDKALTGAQKAGWFRRWILIAPEQIIKTLIHPKYSLYPLLALVALINAGFSSFYAWQLWAGMAVIAPLLLHLHVMKLANKAPNRRLLILRVFGRDANMDLTFGAIRRYWQHIGSTFTVVDPSYIRYKYRGHSENQISVIFFSCLAWAWIFGTPAFNDWFYIGPIVGVIIVLGYIVAMIFMYLQAPHSFAKNRAQIDGRIEKFMQRPRRWDLSFKDLDMYCFDDTWEEAVSAFTESSDVVLMDLRGFSQQNKGCATEINFLFDTITLDRIVFLVDDENDAKAADEMIRDLWEKLKVGSPNLAITSPVATMFNIKGQNAEDVKGLINTLVTAARKQ
jgi:hypothetical protein